VSSISGFDRLTFDPGTSPDGLDGPEVDNAGGLAFGREREEGEEESDGAGPTSSFQSHPLLSVFRERFPKLPTEPPDLTGDRSENLD